MSAGPSSSDFDAAGPSSYVIAAGPSSSILARAHRRLAHELARQMLHFNVPFFCVRKLRPTGLVLVNVLFYYAEFLGPRSGADRGPAAAAPAAARRAPLPITGWELCARVSNTTLAAHAYT